MWPRENSHKYKKRWLHSDIIQIGYPHVYRVFEDIILRGELR